MPNINRLKDRTQAGELLARRLQAYARHPDAIVLALPRGGVPVGYAIAAKLELPLDVLLVRKLGLPGHEEYAIGAIASGGVRIVDPVALQGLHIEPEVVDAIAARELKEIARREVLYRGNRPLPSLDGRIVIVVDDGVATGATFRAALAVVAAQHPARVVAAIPVAPAETCQALEAEVDELVCLAAPLFFRAVSQWYQDFDQTSDAEVQALLEQARRTALPRDTSQRSGTASSERSKR